MDKITKAITENTAELKSLKNDTARIGTLVEKHDKAYNILAAILLVLGISGIGSLGITGWVIPKALSAAAAADEAKETASSIAKISIQSTELLGELAIAIDGAESQQFEPGMIIPWYSPKAPNGWLICDGVKQHNTNDYPILYKTLNENNPDPRNTESYFYTPNFSDRFLRGASITDKAAGKHIDAQIGSHTHPMFGRRTANFVNALNPGGHIREHAAYSSGAGPAEDYQIKISPDTPKDELRGQTYENESTGNWPDHVTVYFIIKHDPPKRTEDESKISTTESD